MHAMRGISAHSNGFHTCRALHLLQLLLGAVDAPGSFRYQPPFLKPILPRTGPARRASPMACWMPRRWASCTGRKILSWTKPASAASTMRIRGHTRCPRTG